MRVIGLLLLGMASAAVAQAPSFQPVGSMSELMIRIIYPTSDALFYIERDPPKTDLQWNAIRAQALILAESGNLMLLPNRLRDQGDWIKETKVMIDLADHRVSGGDGEGHGWNSGGQRQAGRFLHCVPPAVSDELSEAGAPKTELDTH